jgi:hypothetical protein
VPSTIGFPLRYTGVDVAVGVVLFEVNVAPVVLPLFLKVVVDICNQDDELGASLITDLNVNIGGVSKFEPVPVNV